MTTRELREGLKIKSMKKRENTTEVIESTPERKLKKSIHQRKRMPENNPNKRIAKNLKKTMKTKKSTKTKIKVIKANIKAEKEVERKIQKHCIYIFIVF